MRLAEWCRTIIPSDGIFSLHWTTIIHSFSSILFLWQLYLSLDMRYFFSILRWNKYIFDQEMFVSPPISDVLTSCMRLSYTRWYKTEISITGENREKPCWVCKKRLVVCIKRFLKLVSYNRTFTVLTINQLFGMYLKHAMRKGFVGTYAHTLLFLS